MGRRQSGLVESWRSGQDRISIKMDEWLANDVVEVCRNKIELRGWSLCTEEKY